MWQHTKFSNTYISMPNEHQAYAFSNWQRNPTIASTKPALLTVH